MPQTRKIATCCYCGTRAVLVLDRSRHELACSACGAPLHEMKLMPVPQEVPKNRPVRAAAPAQSLPDPRRRWDNDYRVKFRKKEKRWKRKTLSRRIFEEVWDVVEDIFD